MAILDSLKQAIDRLTGAEERRRQQEAAERKAEAQRRADESLADQALKEKSRADELKRQDANQLDRSPVERLLKVDRLNTPAPEQKPEKEPEIATHMQLTPGLQRGPSMGGPGKVFVNPNISVRKPGGQTDQPEPSLHKQPQPMKPSVQPKPEAQPVRAKQPALTADQVAERIQRNVQNAIEHDNLVKQLQEGRRGKLELEIDLGRKRKITDDLH